MSNRFQRWVVGELMKPVVLAGAILEKLTSPLLKPRAIRSSVARENQFRMEIEHQLSFLFDEYKGEVIADRSLEHPLPFDYAVVIVAFGDFLLRFIRGRGEFSVYVASTRAPDEWSDLYAVLGPTVGQGQFRGELVSSLGDVAALLKSRVGS
jgi:hypothetical protein